MENSSPLCGGWRGIRNSTLGSPGSINEGLEKQVTSSPCEPSVRPKGYTPVWKLAVWNPRTVGASQQDELMRNHS